MPAGGPATAAANGTCWSAKATSPRAARSETVAVILAPPRPCSSICSPDTVPSIQDSTRSPSQM
ncbi:hypothetical protein BJF90_34205 [Pseudonocardia sp. CNS-004]|nr:hypothetical protein BJF90_34205 [Pseudonocardia sp. CNS-004]